MPELTVKPLRHSTHIFNLYKEMGGQSEPLLRILQLVHRSGARYCLLWDDYDNQEWNTECSELYSNVFPCQPEYVSRLDFFLKNPLRDSVDNTYFGYVCLRPGPLRTVVECIISPPCDRKDHYLLCKEAVEKLKSQMHALLCSKTVSSVYVLTPPLGCYPWSCHVIMRAVVA